MNLEISAKSLQKYIKSKQDKRKNIYKQLLIKCYKHINFNAKRKHQYFCIFIVPVLNLGIPIIDINNCIYYIKKKLEKKDFKVTVLENNSLYISW